MHRPWPCTVGDSLCCNAKRSHWPAHATTVLPTHPHTLGTAMLPPPVRSRRLPSCTTSTATLPPAVVASTVKKREGPRASRRKGDKPLLLGVPADTATASMEGQPGCVSVAGISVGQASMGTPAASTDNTHRDAAARSGSSNHVGAPSEEPGWPSCSARCAASSALLPLSSRAS